MTDVQICPVCKRDEVVEVMSACNKCGKRVCPDCRTKEKYPKCKDCNKKKHKPPSLDKFFK